MKKIITISFYFFFLSSFGQTSLPYFTGFDNTAEQAGWNLYRKGSTISSPWAYSLQTQLPYSGTKCLIHYYPVSEPTLDWFVSPAFDFSTGGKIDTLRFAFAGFSSAPTVSDTIALFLLSGSPDPDLATNKISLIDFRGNNYINDDVWRDTNNIVIPPTSGLSYIAFKYKGSSSWLDVRFDNLALSANGSAPVASFSISSSSICSGDAITFSDQSTNNPTSWSWQFPGGSPATSTLSNPTVSFSNSGNVTVQLTSTNSFGSSSPAIQAITINACTGLSYSKMAIQKIKVFPNPSSGKYTLEGDFDHSVTFQVFNMLGEEVMKGVLDANNSKTIHIESQIKGFYFLKIEDEHLSKTIKMIKE